jgi:hypothetical protein
MTAAWECPRCLQINGPLTLRCNCKPDQGLPYVQNTTPSHWNYSLCHCGKLNPIGVDCDHLILASR